MIPKPHTAALGALLLLLGCSPESYRKEADDEVYAIVTGLSKEVYGEERSFSIETPEDSLRASLEQNLMQDEVLPQPMPLETEKPSVAEENLQGVPVIAEVP